MSEFIVNPIFGKISQEPTLDEIRDALRFVATDFQHLDQCADGRAPGADAPSSFFGVGTSVMGEVIASSVEPIDPGDTTDVYTPEPLS